MALDLKKLKGMKMPAPAAEKEAADDLDLESLGEAEAEGESPEMEASEGMEEEMAEGEMGEMDGIPDEDLVAEIVKRGLQSEVAAVGSSEESSESAPY